MPGLPCTAAVPQRRHPVQLAGPNAHCACGTCERTGWPWQSCSPGTMHVSPLALPLPAPPLPLPQRVATRDGILRESAVGGHCSSPACCSVLPAFPATSLPRRPKLSVTCCSPVPAQLALSPGKLLTRLFRGVFVAWHTFLRSLRYGGQHGAMHSCTSGM